MSAPHQEKKKNDNSLLYVLGGVAAAIGAIKLLSEVEAQPSKRFKTGDKIKVSWSVRSEGYTGKITCVAFAGSREIGKITGHISSGETKKVEISGIVTESPGLYDITAEVTVEGGRKYTQIAPNLLNVI